VAGLGFEKYAEATVEDYLDLVEEVSTRVASSETVTHQAIAEQLGVSPEVVAHIIHYHELL
jgi:Mn-dependent DtxR family transcriptional regulator